MGKPKVKKKPGVESVRIGADPESYLKMKPVWRFSDFDWDGPFGHDSCVSHIANIRSHVEDHLANFESMTWDEILKAAGGKKSGNNNHHIARDKFKKDVQKRLEEKNIHADTLFSLRLDQGTRIYGVRELNCLRIVFFDPHHKDHGKSAYEFS
ncbi:hypothetical protein FJ952_26250 [Mesorhizobium sp. B2-4-10]|uniref:hypothetical protein n=1 Tax=Mesorhizobium sp. B2-4-10 TaxID=2589939 RepID=UPI00112C0018|nr:hypothetical protein [Mesorhizobium sp. B2-4-10]TPL11416.1 hypothetical protein FJ952_26250 [Mesorhizobium sp. B2-4-10]